MELKDIRKEYLDYAKALQPLREAHAHRVRMYVGDQWADVKPRPKKNRPQSVINFYKRHVDVLYGYILANRTDLKLHPVEGADDLSCDIRSRLLQWIFSDRNYYTNFCLGAQDAFIGGMGWVAIDRVFDYDLVNGDICVYQTQFDEILTTRICERLTPAIATLFSGGSTSRTRWRLSYGPSLKPNFYRCPAARK